MTTETDYWCRLALTVDEHGGNALTDVIHNQSNGLPKDPKALYKELDTKHRQNFSQAFKDQKELLFPLDQQTHTDKFDITLKISVITNCKIILKNNPKATYVDDIRKLRNELMHYVNYKFMSKDKFETLWTKLDSYLRGLGYSKDISYMKTKVLDQNEKKKIIELEKEQKNILNQLKSHDTRITAHDTRITANESEITANVTQIREHDTRITAHDDRITANEAEITEHDTRITANESEITANVTQIREHDTRITAHDDRITANEAEITEHDTRITANESGITANVTQIREHDTRITSLEEESKRKKKEMEEDPCKEDTSNDAMCQIAARELWKITNNYRNKQGDVILDLTSSHSDEIPLNDDRKAKYLRLNEHNYVLRISKEYSNELHDILSFINKEHNEMPVPDEITLAHHSSAGESFFGIYSHTSQELYEYDSVNPKDFIKVVSNEESNFLNQSSWEKFCSRYLRALSHNEQNGLTETIDVATEAHTDLQEFVKRLKRIKRKLPVAIIGDYNPIEHCNFLYKPQCDTTSESFQNFLVVIRQEPFEILCLSLTFSYNVKDVLLEIQKGCKRVKLVAKANHTVVKSIASKPSIYHIVVAPNIQTDALNEWCCKFCVVMPKEIYNDGEKMSDFFHMLPKCGEKNVNGESFKKLASFIIGFVATSAEKKKIWGVTSHDLIQYTRLTNQQEGILSSLIQKKYTKSIIRGDYGSGKTILGIFLLKNIVDSAQQEKQPTRVWYIVFQQSELLLQKVQKNLKKFFPVKNENENSKWCYKTTLESSSITIDICTAAYIETEYSTVSKLSSILRTLQKSLPKVIHHFIIDEYDGEGLDLNEAENLKELTVSEEFNKSYIVVLVQSLQKIRTYHHGERKIEHDKFKYSDTGMTENELRTAMRNPKEIHKLITAAKQSISSWENVLSYNVQNGVQKKKPKKKSCKGCSPIRLNFFPRFPFNVRNKKKRKPTTTETQFHSSNNSNSEQPNLSSSSQETQKTQTLNVEKDFDVIASALHDENMKGDVKTTTQLEYRKCYLGNKIECEKKPVFVSFKSICENDIERFAGLFIYFKQHFFTHHITSALFICDDIDHQRIYHKILQCVGKDHILLNDLDEDKSFKSCDENLSIICNTRSSSGCEFPNVVVCVHPKEHHLRHHFVDNVSRCTSYLTMACLSNYEPTSSDLPYTTLHHTIKHLKEIDLFKYIPLEFDSFPPGQEHEFKEESSTTFKINRDSDSFQQFCNQSFESGAIKNYIPSRSELFKRMTDGLLINTQKDDDGGDDGVVGADGENDDNKTTNVHEDGGNDGVVGADGENDDNKTTNVDEDGGNDGVAGADEENDDNKTTNVSSVDTNEYSKTDILQLILNNDFEEVRRIYMLNPNQLNDGEFIYSAVEHYKPKVLKILLKVQNSDIDFVTKTKRKHTSLHLACEKGYNEIVELLIRNNARVDEKDKKGRTPLYVASREGRKDIVELLIRNKARVDEKDNNGRTPLYVASWFGHKEIVELLIRNNARVDEKDKKGQTPLYAASSGGHKEIVELLIRNKARVDEKDSVGWTPLHVASWKEHKEIVELLIRNNARVDEKDNNGWTPLHRASLEGHKEIVELLIRNKARVDEKDKKGRTPLYAASWFGHKEIVELLIRNNARVDEKDKKGQTPLHVASSEGHKEIVELLIRNNARVDEKDNNGLTPLHRASSKGHKEIVELLNDYSKNS